MGKRNLGYLLVGNFFATLVSLDGSAESTYLKNFASDCLSSTLNVIKHIPTGISQELSFSEHTYDRVSSGITRELLACSRLGLGALAASCIWGAVNNKIATHFYPDYFSRGYTSRSCRIIQFNIEALCELPPSRQQNLVRPVKFALERLLFTFAGSLPIIHAARAGNLPQLSVRHLILPTGVSLAFMAGCSWLMGKISHRLVRQGKLRRLSNYVADPSTCRLLPPEEHYSCLAATYAHNVGLVSSAVATLGLCAWMIDKRYGLDAKC